jgi:hypothetical protein
MPSAGCIMEKLCLSADAIPDASKFLSASEAVSIDSAVIAVDCRAGTYNSKELVRLRF